MKRFLTLVLFILLVAAMSLGVLAVGALRVRYPLTGQASSSKSTKGVWHIHTQASHDGWGHLDEVVSAAQEAGLRFVVVTEHNPATVKSPEWRAGVLVLHGAEWSTPDGHVVGVAAQRPVSKEELVKEPLEKLHQAGAATILAHPVQEKNPWRNWEEGSRADGMELYSMDTFWRSLGTAPVRTACVVASLLSNPTHGMMLMAFHHPEAVGRLLHQAKQRQQVALCALDAHGVPSYHRVFPLMSMHLPINLPSEPQMAEQAVWKALFSGKGYCVFDALGDASGFELRGTRGGLELEVGDRVQVKMPAHSGVEARVMAYGNSHVESDGLSVVMDNPGAALIQVELLAPECLFGKRWVPWIVSSPFTIRPRR